MAGAVVPEDQVVDSADRVADPAAHAVADRAASEADLAANLVVLPILKPTSIGRWSSMPTKMAS